MRHFTATAFFEDGSTTSANFEADGPVTASSDAFEMFRDHPAGLVRVYVSQTERPCDMPGCGERRAPGMMFCDPHVAEEQDRWLAEAGV